MNNEDNNLDLLDLDDDTPVETLPETTPFAAPRPRKPWLLMGLGLVVIILATYIIVRTIGNNSSETIEIDLDAPEVVTPDSINTPKDVLNVPAKPVPVEAVQKPEPVPAPQPAVQPVPQPKPAPQPVVENNGVPVRVVSDRREVVFNPDKPVVEQPKPVAKPQSAPQVASQAKPATKTETKPAAKAAAPRGSWYVQFGSYSSRALAENAERQMRNSHKSLFEGKQFVILAAQLPNGTTTYRLRVAFSSSGDANGFCQNAKSDGLDCYVAK